MDKKFPLQCFTDKKRSEESYKVISVITSHEYNITKLIWGGFFRKGIQNGLKRMGSKNYIKRDRAINLIRENLQKIEESLKSAEKVVSEASDFSIQPDYSQSQKPMTEHLSYLKFV
ncbi:MAG: hypothetical protein JSV39_03395 [Candidatus Aenigmatarchaeota archaeon]|nr:MAG: hypothetical protein JSV39_03395 [Candidatus Aenigmarchaeota archaeon]